MSTFLLIALIPPFMWGAINHIDKYAVERFMKGRDPAALILFTGLAAIVMGAFVYAFAPIQHLPLTQSVGMILAGTALVFSYIPYLHALSRDEASNVAPLFQLVTPVAYILALVFLHEHVALPQLASGALIFIGALALSFDFGAARIRRRSFGLMLLASTMIACNVVMFKHFALETTFWTTVWYDLVGAALAGVLLFTFWKNYRRTFLSVIKEYRYRVVGVNMLAETLNIFARIINGFVSLSVPIVIIQFIIGLQPICILVIGILLTRFIPSWGKEAIDRRSLVRKFGAIALMLSGVVLLLVVS